MIYALHPSQSRLNQQGIVLIMSLILLTVVSLVAIYTLRDSVTGEQISKNLRSNTIATQAAETALRICEQAVSNGKVKLSDSTSEVNFIVLEPTENMATELPMQWNDRTNWSAQKSNRIPSALITDASMRSLPSPRCMVENYILQRDYNFLRQPSLITAIGYTPDYKEDSKGSPISGGEVWLQSIFRP